MPLVACNVYYLVHVRRTNMADYTPVLKQEQELPKQDQAEETVKEEEKKETVAGLVRPLKLFKYSDRYDVVLIIVGTLSALAAGAGMPVVLYYYTDVVSAFIYLSIYQKLDNRTLSMALGYKFGPDDVMDIHPFVRDNYAIPFAMTGLAVVALTVLQNICWTFAGEKQSERIRRLYFKALLSHTVSWYDVNNNRAAAAKFTRDMESISLGIGQKFGNALHWFAVWLICNIAALVLLWKLALACLAFFPINVLAGFAMTKVALRATNREKEEYGLAGAIAEEVFSAIKTVMAFNGQEKECKRFQQNLKRAEKQIAIKGIVLGLGVSVANIVFLAITCVAMWYGLELFFTENIEPGNVLSIVILVSVGALGLVTVFHFTEYLVEAREAAFRVYSIIDTSETQESSPREGLIPKSINGHIEVKNVFFSYPSRPDIQVLKDASFSVGAGKTVALVGQSGCGKTTIVQLLEKFYHPQQGSIFIDGSNIKDIDTEWFRRQIGFVGQEPVLFSTSIAENIRFGNANASDKDIMDAAQTANAHDFIMELPKGYDTYVGDFGSQLSGGQKQRIAIARALVRNPAILLMDEATSALDTASEAVVQRAIDKAKEGRTTIIIAHRLSTVIGADQILVVKNGEIIEQGTHKELIDKGGYYLELAQSQVQTFNDMEGVSQTEDPISALTSINASDKLMPETLEAADTKVAVSTVKSPMRKVLSLMSPEKHLVVIGILFSAIFAFCVPIQAIAVSESLSLFQDSPEDGQAAVNKIIGIVMGVVGGALIFRIISVIALAKASARLTTRVREELFKSIVYQDLNFFEKEENRIGVLTTRLSNDSIAIHGVSALKLSTNIEGVVGLLCALSVALYYSWKLSLVLMAVAPASAMAGYFIGKQVSSTDKDDASQSKSVEDTGQIVQESLSNIRLVFAFTSETILMKKFSEASSALFRASAKREIPTGIIGALFDGSLFFNIAIALSYGSFLVQNDGLKFHLLFRVFMLINQASLIIGRTSGLSPDYIRAKFAAGRVFKIIERSPTINVNGFTGKEKDEFRGDLQLKDVNFSYSSRLNLPVLKKISLSVESGKTLALVGNSGCGKSTIVSLIERFYDPSSGEVLADQTDIRELNIHWFRGQIGMVAQEPVLFDISVAENIQYGDISRSVPMSEVIEAARLANLHDFVVSLPQGYDTMCGDKGTQLSGGEKQRVAIARALIRKPKLLLLDEATAALDSYNEMLVKEALENATEGRTTIIISHRLSTIKECHQIAVIHNGSVVELGDHTELVEKKGLYYRLLQAQNK